jgi:hypothetical protein
MDQEEISKLYELLEEIRQIIAKNDSHLISHFFDTERKRNTYPTCSECGIGLLKVYGGDITEWICPIHRNLGVQYLGSLKE